MIYTPMTNKALQLCFEAHKEQRDKSGIPYVFHPFHLAEQMETEETVTVALLHDVLEDNPGMVDDLKKAGFPPVVWEALALLTHDPDEPYMAYVARIKEHPVARAVKLADLRHNSDTTRLLTVTPKDEERAAKYREAIAFLLD